MKTHCVKLRGEICDLLASYQWMEERKDLVPSSIHTRSYIDVEQDHLQVDSFQLVPAVCVCVYKSMTTQSHCIHVHVLNSKGLGTKLKKYLPSTPTVLSPGPLLGLGMRGLPIYTHRIHCNSIKSSVIDFWH